MKYLRKLAAFLRRVFDGTKEAHAKATAAAKRADDVTNRAQRALELCERR